MATFKVGPQAKILTKNPLLTRRTLDGLWMSPLENTKAAAFSQKAKKYLLDVCWTGEEPSKKSTDSNVASQIKSLRDDTGQNCCLRLTG